MRYSGKASRELGCKMVSENNSACQPFVLKDGRSLCNAGENAVDSSITHPNAFLRPYEEVIKLADWYPRLFCMCF